MAFSKIKTKLFFVLIFIFLSTFPIEINSLKDSKEKSDKQITKADEKSEETSTIKPTDKPCICPTPKPDVVEPNNESHGFGAGSIFLSILFGMLLMFGLTQLYTHWEKRRLGDVSTYPGY